MRWKRPLYLLHRWAGIVLCLFFALWFVSGIFMMYVEFPQLTRAERLAGSQPLDFSTATLTPGEALTRLRSRDFARRATPTALAHAGNAATEIRAVERSVADDSSTSAPMKSSPSQ